MHVDCVEHNVRVWISTKPIKRRERNKSKMLPYISTVRSRADPNEESHNFTMNQLLARSNCRRFRPVWLVNWSLLLFPVLFSVVSKVISKASHNSALHRMKTVYIYKYLFHFSRRFVLAWIGLVWFGLKWRDNKAQMIVENNWIFFSLLILWVSLLCLSAGVDTKKKKREKKRERIHRGTI